MTKELTSVMGIGQKCKRLAAAVFAAAVMMAAVPVSVSAAAAGAQQYIGEEKAKSVALENAGISEGEATFLKVHLDYEDGYVVYDVEFFSGNTEYDYEIDAINGKILEYDEDIEYYSIPSRSSPSTNAGQYIGEESAKAAALSHAGVSESSATFIKAYLDNDDGYIVYDVEFYSGNTEYDYEIDALSGEIYEFDKEIEYYSIPQSSSGRQNSRPADTGNYIGEAKAKSVALGHAGIDESSVTAISVHLDYDDGRVDYDVEFYSDNTEYEYEIDAVNGNILEYDRETKYRARNAAGTSGRAQEGPAQQTAPGTGSYIGEAGAKSVALSNAGLAESQLRKIKVKLELEHGTTVYEVEFKSGQMEYEYEIDAVSGAIIESDAEYDD